MARVKVVPDNDPTSEGKWQAIAPCEAARLKLFPSAHGGFVVEARELDLMAPKGWHATCVDLSDVF